MLNKRTSDFPVLAYLFLAIAILILSFAPILIRLSESDLGPYGTIFNRFWIATLALCLFRAAKAFYQERDNSLLDAQPTTFSAQDKLNLILGAVLNSACLVIWAWSLMKTSVANSNLLHNTTPIFTTLGGWLLLRQSFNRRFLIGMLVSLGGACLLGFQDFEMSQETLIGDGAALLSAVFYAGTFLVIERLRNKFDTVTILMWNCGLGSLLLFPLTLLFEERLFPVSWEGWLSVASLGVICTLLGSGALFYSLKQLSSGFVSVMMLLEPMIAAFLAWILFSEKLGYLNGITLTVVLAGIYLAKSASLGGLVLSESELTSQIQNEVLE